MDLGTLRLRCQGANVLQGGLHKDHGVVWTEGRSIFLAPVSIFQDQVENQEPSKLGEFDRGVKSINWSEEVSPGLCYMCVVHEKNISIWKVEGYQPKLTFKQIRKVNIQPIPQGCIWSPGRDVLCALCPQQSSLYYSHTDRKGSQVLIQLDMDKIHCGCWTSDGSKLVIAVSATLMIYEWSDIDESVTNYQAVQWTIPGLCSKVNSFAAVSTNRILCATELPLERLCKLQDTFVLPDLLTSNSNGPIKEEFTDEEIIKPKGKESATNTDSLLHLKRNPDSVLEDSSKLDVIDLYTDRVSELVTSLDVKGVLTPDLLLYQANSDTIVVGCNSQTLIQIFKLEDNKIIKTGEINLDIQERPKGIASFQGNSYGNEEGVLILIGKKELTDTAFPSSSAYANMKSVLKFFNVKQGRYSKNHLTHTASVPSIPTSVETNGNHDKRDGDNIYESVMTFGIHQKYSQSSRDVSNNNNVRKPVSKSSSVLIPKSDNDSEKANGSYRNSFHGDFDAFAKARVMKTIGDNIPEEAENGVKVNGNIRHSIHGDFDVKSKENVGLPENGLVIDESAPVPPKRPLRKKKSMRNREDLSRTSSNSSQERSRANSGVSGSLPMEYLSDCSEMSPRDSPRIDGRKLISAEDAPISSLESEMLAKWTETSAALVNQVGNVQGHPDSQGVPEKDADTVNIVSAEVKKVPAYVDVQEENTYPDTSKVLTIHIGSKSESFNRHGQIEEIGSTMDNESQSLEIEKANFESQTSNFKTSDFGSLCGSETESQKVVMEMLEKKLQTRDSDRVVPDRHVSDRVVYDMVASDRVVSDFGACSTSLSGGHKFSTSLESLDDIDKILKEQNLKISKLQEQMSQLSRRIDDSVCVLPSRYQQSSKPETVQLCFRCKDGFKIEKKFLLDSGRLKLEQVQQAFSLDTVEMFLDDEACVVGCNIDGYIPLRFESGSTIFISGKPALK
ncbi:uncharacterized protein LOC127851239 isoform X2 [Dreissena polymorpha]|uniref:WD repeat and coiled-coil-containing protein n=1 Tax=Dreissena polymorpha TaxID=45954 RepID=A0A9D4CWB7_DREPO|nr:uncharacterized protein LOC127851239 isoform X2 [Dreissena polymorpha]KAH3734522.1 hypothetical protein DPMN_040961 [Dreissena polymorpha]